MKEDGKMGGYDGKLENPRMEGGMLVVELVLSTGERVTVALAPLVISQLAAKQVMRDEEARGQDPLALPSPRKPSGKSN